MGLDLPDFLRAQAAAPGFPAGRPWKTIVHFGLVRFPAMRSPGSTWSECSASRRSLAANPPRGTVRLPSGASAKPSPRMRQSDRSTRCPHCLAETTKSRPGISCRKIRGSAVLRPVKQGLRRVGRKIRVSAAEAAQDKSCNGPAKRSLNELIPAKAARDAKAKERRIFLRPLRVLRATEKSPQRATKRGGNTANTRAAAQPDGRRSAQFSS